MRKNIVVPLCAVIIMAMLCATYVWTTMHARTGERTISYRDFENRPVPVFTVTTLTGDRIASTGKQPTLIELFATWCGHCQSEVKTMNRLSRKYRSKVRIVAISTDWYGRDLKSKSNWADVRWFARTYGTEYPIAFDPSGTLRKTFAVPAYPEVLMVNRSGVVTYNGFGEVPYNALDAAIASTL